MTSSLVLLCASCGGRHALQGSDVCPLCELAMALTLRDRLLAAAPAKAAARMDEFALRFEPVESPAAGSV